MVKSELIQHIATKMQLLPTKVVDLGVNHILERMSMSLVEGQRIEIRGFGSFALRYRAPRQAHNPRTGECAYTQAKYTPHFKPGKDLRNRVNDNRHLCAIREFGNQGEEQDDDESMQN